MMHVVIVKNQKEMDAALADAKEKGLKLVCKSNTGLVKRFLFFWYKTKWRLTFLPKEAVKNNADET